MQRRDWRTFLALLPILALASCTPGFDVLTHVERTAGQYKVSFSFSERLLWFRWSASACIEEVRVETEENRRPVWTIASDGLCVNLSGLTYGKVPRGFKEALKAAPLVAGPSYSIQATAEPTGGGEGRFNL
jgi:hypothetical protein